MALTEVFLCSFWVNCAPPQQKEKAQVQAQEDADRLRQDRELQAQQEEEERQRRKKVIKKKEHPKDGHCPLNVLNSEFCD